MTGMFTVERPTVVAAANHAQYVSDEIAAQLVSLRNQLETVLTPGMNWQGDGQQAFAMVHERWQEATTRINSALQDIVRTLSASQNNYETSDSNGKRWVVGAGAAL